MHNIMSVILIIVSVLIIGVTLIQGKGGGLGSAWGGAGGFQTRRGLEKWLLRFTAFLVFVFFVLSVINFLS